MSTVVEQELVRPLIDLVDHAMTLASTDATVDAIKTNLCKLIRSGTMEVPAAVHKTVPGRYARRLLHKDDELGYSIVAMTWAPGQSTAIHDHAGMWCVEGVWAGSINVQQYELMEVKDDDEQYRFEGRNSYEAGIGSAGCLIPPYEYHLIENLCDTVPAVSIHIYGGEMMACHTFEETDSGWHQRNLRALGYDN